MRLGGSESFEVESFICLIVDLLKVESVLNFLNNFEQSLLKTEN